MTIPNLIALLLLSPVILKETNHYLAEMKRQKAVRKSKQVQE
jgi:Na+/alanine symporter